MPAKGPGVSGYQWETHRATRFLAASEWKKTKRTYKGFMARYPVELLYAVRSAAALDNADSVVPIGSQ
ncbi:hypothetical protein GCM10011348_34910 [Marinobacterium nitratireducens]|uniref:Uncharacterized protein n=1 Tax=Marinobacterium nitratireducens TaxID=518897 RepID=A0A917ZKL9_9GAMM|nr:hypothetical protein GCM10011348_34910 [Marinobacterium nitratireducens]